METEDEIKRRPIAISNGFRSGFAKDTIFLNEDAVSGLLLSAEGTTLASTEGFVVGGFGGAEVGAEDSHRGLLLENDLQYVTAGILALAPGSGRDSEDRNAKHVLNRWPEQLNESPGPRGLSSDRA